MEPSKPTKPDDRKSRKRKRRLRKSNLNAAFMNNLLKQHLDTRVQKRPIMHPPIPSPYAGADQPKVIYVSSKTPFISTVKRVRKLLSLIEKRSMGKVDLISGKGGDKEKLRALDTDGASKTKGREEVVLKATNRAIETALNLALFFQKQEDLTVRFRTGTVSVVDDIVKVASTAEEAEGDDQEEDVQETQVRKICMLEVAITLKLAQ